VTAVGRHLDAAAAFRSAGNLPPDTTLPQVALWSVDLRANLAALHLPLPMEPGATSSCVARLSCAGTYSAPLLHTLMLLVGCSAVTALT